MMDPEDAPGAPVGNWGMKQQMKDFLCKIYLSYKNKSFKIHFLSKVFLSLNEQTSRLLEPAHIKYLTQIIQKKTNLAGSAKAEEEELYLNMIMKQRGKYIFLKKACQLAKIYCTKSHCSAVTQLLQLTIMWRMSCKGTENSEGLRKHFVLFAPFNFPKCVCNVILKLSLCKHAVFSILTKRSYTICPHLNAFLHLS